MAQIVAQSEAAMSQQQQRQEALERALREDKRNAEVSRNGWSAGAFLKGGLVRWGKDLMGSTDRLV